MRRRRTCDTMVQAVQQTTLRFVISCGLLLAAARVGLAQWVPTTAFGVRDGVAQSQITAIIQDRTGFLWIATQGGLTRHNGRDFTTFTRSHGLPDDLVTALAPDSADGLWLGFDSGTLGHWNGLEFSTFQLNNSGAVTAILPSSDNDILVGTDGGLIRWLDGQPQIIDPQPVLDLAAGDECAWVLTARLSTFCDGLLAPLAWSDDLEADIVALDLTELGVWIGSSSGLVRLITKQGRELRRTTVDAPPSSLLSSSSGTLWIGTTSGLWSFAANGQLQQRPLHADNPGIEIRTLYEDHENNLWIGSWSDGIHRLTPDSFTVFDRSSGLAASTVWRFFEDPDGCVWIATEDAGVVRWCPGGWDVHLLSGRELPPGRCLALEGDGLGGLFIGSANGVIHRSPAGELTLWTTEDGLPENYIRDLHLDDSGLLWAATRAGLASWNGTSWTAWTEESGLPDGNLRGLDSDRNGNLWMATHNVGVVRFDGESFFTFGTEQGLPNNRIWCLTIDSAERLWAGTDAGIWVQAIAGGEHFTVIGEAGLPSLNVLFLHEDLEGLMWAGTTRGVSLLDPQGRVLRTLTAQDGLTDSEAAENAVMVDSAGLLWMGLAHGATRLDPGHLPHNATAPPLVVEKIIADGTPWPAADPVAASWSTTTIDTIVLPPRTSDLRLEFSALSFTSPDKVRYRFMLEGFDRELGPPTDENHVTYRRVPPGSYRFVLTASNNDGVWTPESLELPIELLPAWFETDWFRALIVILLAAAPVGTFLGYRRGQRRRRQVLEALVSERTSDLAAANSRISEQNLELESLSRTDPLTGLANRRVLEEIAPLELALIERELARHPEEAAANIRGMALLVVDIDHFKKVNDRYGHEVGDQALVAVAATLSRTLRAIDVCVRWGGEEFVILARSTNREAILALVRRLLTAMAELTVHANGESISISASIGFVASPLACRELLPAIEWRSLLDIADRLMYLAKERGRARACGVLVTLSEPPDTSEREVTASLLGDVTIEIEGIEPVEMTAVTEINARPQ